MFALQHTDDGAFYSKNYTWVRITDGDLSNTLVFPTVLQAEEFSKTLFSEVQLRHIEIKDLDPKPSQLSNVHNLTITHQSPVVINADVEIYRAAIALMCDRYDEETAIQTAERVWLKVKHDRKET